VLIKKKENKKRRVKSMFLIKNIYDESEKCPKCSGTGVYEDGGMMGFECDRCAGSGKIIRDKNDVLDNTCNCDSDICTRLISNTVCKLDDAVIAKITNLPIKKMRGRPKIIK
jgi:hypothetical protein